MLLEGHVIILTYTHSKQYFLFGDYIIFSLNAIEWDETVPNLWNMRLSDGSFIQHRAVEIRTTNVL
jgi:hypothetical protein